MINGSTRDHFMGKQALPCSRHKKPYRTHRHPPKKCEAGLQPPSDRTRDKHSLLVAQYIARLAVT